MEPPGADPEAVVAEARGEVDEWLLTRTEGGLLRRNVLADAPLIELLDPAETLQYLLSGPAAPARIAGDDREPVETAGSYRTLLSVTDRRLLVVAGSADGDRTVSLPYGEVHAVEHDPGLLTDEVLVRETPDRALSIAVRGGSDPAKAVAYANDRAESAPTPDGRHDDPPTDAALREGPAIEAPEERTEGGSSAQRRTETGSSADASAELPSPVGAESSGRTEPELIGALFERLVDGVEAGDGADAADLDAAVRRLRRHHERFREHVAGGDSGAARAAAAAVDELADAVRRLAADRGRPELAARAGALRAGTRRELVGAELDVELQDDLDGELGPTVKRLLRGLDPDAFEHLVADLWAALGYQTAVTQSSGDRGIDVVARRSSPVEETALVQAKRYGPDTTVGSEAIQQYASLHRQEREADLVVVVTTSTFTAPARELAADLNVKLVDGDRLVELIEEVGAYDAVAERAVERGVPEADRER